MEESQTETRALAQSLAWGVLIFFKEWHFQQRDKANPGPGMATFPGQAPPHAPVMLEADVEFPPCFFMDQQQQEVPDGAMWDLEFPV